MARGGFETSGASSNRRSINALDLYSSLVIHLSFLISLRRKASGVKACAAIHALKGILSGPPTTPEAWTTN